MAQVSHIPRTDSRQTFKPELDVAKQLGREILRPQWASCAEISAFPRVWLVAGFLWLPRDYKSLKITL
jgi:hypothetical protein